MTTSELIDYERVFSSLPTLRVLLDRDFKIIAATDAYISISLTTREAIMGMNVLEAFPTDPSNPHSNGMSKLSESLQSVLTQKQLHDMGIILYDIPSGAGDGTFVERWWRCRNQPVLDSDGEVRWIISNVDDINDMMDKLESAEEALKLKVADKL